MKRRLAVLTIGTLCVLPVTAAAASASAETGRSLNVVAMGDSYGSGTGAGDYQNGTQGKCFRSSNSYSELLVKKLRERGGRVNFTNVTCSGAAISTLRQSFKGEKPQFNALRRNTDLVFLTIGATDINFAGYGGACVQADCSGAPTRAILAAMPQMGKKLKTLLHAVQARSPRAKIILTGYGRQVTPGPNAKGGQLDPICDPKVFSAAERRQGAIVTRKVDDTLRFAAGAARARGVKVDFVSPFSGPGRLHPSFKGHSLCEGKTPFYRGFDALAQGQEGADAVLHLNQAGQATLAALVARKVPGNFGRGGFGFPKDGGSGFPKNGGSGFPKDGGSGFPKDGGSGFPKDGGSGFPKDSGFNG